MRVKSLATLYPSFVMHGQFDTLTHAENRELADIAWRNQETNYRVSSGIADSEKGFNRPQFVNIIESDADKPVVRKFAKLLDKLVRVYLQDVYKYRHEGPVEMMVDSFCQSEATNTHGMWAHSHVRRPIVISYYPVVDIKRRGSTSPSSGIDGQVNFYDPSGYGKRPFPTNNDSFKSSSLFRVPVVSGDFLAFEGYLPHDSAPFDGKERVCIAAFCKPVFPVFNDGIALEQMCNP